MTNDSICVNWDHKFSLTPFAGGYRKCFSESSFVYDFVVVCDFLNVTGVYLPGKENAHEQLKIRKINKV